MTIHHVNSKGRMSIIKIQNFTMSRRQSVIKLIYGSLFVVCGMISAIVDPVEIFTNWFLEIREDSFIYNMWQKPTYELFTEVWLFNYTNTAEFLSGQEKKLKLQEVGPFKYKEIRSNENIRIDNERGIMTMTPKVDLEFVEKESLALPKDISLNVPNIALIAISTLAADKLGYLANVGAYYSMQASGSKMFRNMTVEEFLWGYKDPIVTIANNLLPGWIDFGKIGIMDRFYAQKTVDVEIELKDKDKRYTIIKWDNSYGLTEQGFTDLNTSTPCNRIEGTYEGLMVAPRWTKDKVLPIFRKQACGTFPFNFQKELTETYGFKYFRYTMDEGSFNRTSPYSCKCTQNCLPDGFKDISGCYYGFPITVSKPHFHDVDPEQQGFFEGMNPDPERYTSYFHFEPTVGVPLSLESNLQVNIAVRTHPGNPILKPIKDKVMPLLRLSMYCREPPTTVANLLRLRFVIAPPLVVTLEVLLLIVGLILGVQGFYRIWKPKYKLIPNNPEPTIKRRKNSVVINVSDNKAFSDDELAKQAVSLLAIKEEDPEAHDFIAGT